MKNNYPVYLQPDGTATVFDLNNHRTRYPNEEHLPMWMQEGLALLRMVEKGDGVEGVGERGWGQVYYLDPPEEHEV